MFLLVFNIIILEDIVHTYCCTRVAGFKMEKRGRILRLYVHQGSLQCGNPVAEGHRREGAKNSVD